LLIAGTYAEGEPTPLQQISNQKIIKKPVVVILPKITGLTPLYDDCQLIFYVKGNFLGQTQGTRVVRMQSMTKTYFPKIDNWTVTQINCRLTGDFELGRTYKVCVWDNATNKMVTNQYDWLVKTELKLTHQGYKPGQVIAVGGCLLGTSQGARKLFIRNAPAEVTQWSCEDIVFKVPNLPPGTYPLYLMEGRLLISNRIKIQII
jgi:hypothetical protein